MKKILTIIFLVLGFIGNSYAQTMLGQGGTGYNTSTPGDLLVGTSSSLRYSRLPIGTSGYVLQASSTSAFKMAWVSTSTLGITAGGGSGTVTSVSVVSPTGLTVSSTTCTTSCVLTIAYAAGYTPVLTASATQWSAAYASTTALTPSYIRGLFSNTVTGLLYTSASGVTSLVAGYVVPLIASTTEWAASYASTTALTPAYLRNLFSNTATGLTYNSSTGGTSLTAGYNIPLTASTTNWNSFWDTPSTRITAGANCSWSTNIFNCTGGSSAPFSTTSINGLATTTFTFATTSTGNDFSISTTSAGVFFNLPSASSVNRGVLSSSDWSLFNSKLGQFFSNASGSAFSAGNLYATSSFNLPYLSNTFISVDQNGVVIATNTPGTTYTGTYPIIVSGSVISSGFSTSTTNVFTAQNTFNSTTTLGHVKSGSSEGLQFFSNANTQVADFGAGGGSNATFLGGLTINGQTSFVNASGTGVTLTNLFAANQRLSGAFRDSTNASGTLGQVLLSTGTSTLWTSTSSLGISGGSLSGGVFGYAARWLSSTALGTSTLIDNGTVAGINATSSTVNFTVRGTGTNNPFSVASSSGSSWFHVASNGAVGIGTTTFATGSSQEKFKVDFGTTSNTTPISAVCMHNTFCQIAVTNSSSTGNASESGFVAQNSSSTDLTGFAWFGKNGTNFSTTTTYSTGYKNDGVIVNHGGSFIIANVSTSSDVRILTGGTATTTATRLVVGRAGAVSVATTTATYGFTVATTSQFTAGIVKRVRGYASAASTTIDVNTTDIATTTITASTTFVNPTGTFYDGYALVIRAKATSTRLIFWGTTFASSTDLQLPSTIASGTTQFGFMYRPEVGKLELLAIMRGFIN